MKQMIVCIVGDSGVGKTTASLILQKQFGWDATVSYTTRPKRIGEIDGVDHWFVSKDKVPSRKQMCAYTKFGGFEYWTTWNQFREPFPCIHVYTIDEKGLVDLMSKDSARSKFKLYTIKIKRDKLNTIDESRRNRDKERINIPDKFYDYIINNNGSMEQFRASLYLTAQCIIQKQEDNDNTAK